MIQQMAPQLDRIPWNEGDVARGILVVLVTSFALILGAGFLLLLPLGGVGNAFILLFALLMEGILMMAAWRFTVGKYHCPWRALGFQAPQARRHLLLVGAILFLGIAFTNIYFIIVGLLKLDFLLPTSSPFLDNQGTVWVVGIVLAALVAPLTEETFFRGFVFSGIRNRHGFIWGASVSSLLFALGHVELGAIFPAFILGFLLAWLYAKTRSLWSCILVHFAYNALVLSVAV